MKQGTDNKDNAATSSDDICVDNKSSVYDNV